MAGADQISESRAPALGSVWAIIANVARGHRDGPGGQQTRVGFKALRAGARVTVIGAFPGSASAVVTVVGRGRYGGGRYITINIASQYLRVHRVGLVYSSHVIGEAYRHAATPHTDLSSEPYRQEVEELAEIIERYVSSRDGRGRTGRRHPG